ncbi:oxygenase MpaB family protein [Solimonas sp. SE-A11]|uniref:oxygenase MpaB family protein n=1 Tax=Solimonas sp. SE-A11 TaxID=3054954 RepID=UPI00259CF135|nr:oxygenase MpaB family protein [Solimonas sp. SE-A11]MDM4770580.1 oxygenase MpaB family protein [Solimonas sp. SE-A11]
MAEGSARPAIPRRHGADLETGRRMAGPLRWLIRGNPEPSPTQWQAIGESLNQGDPAMDQLVDWMAAEGLRHTKPLFDRALDQGIAALPDAPEPLRRFFVAVEARPAWVKPALLAEGARACGISGLTGMDVLRDFGLMAGYQAGAINRSLVLTGALQKGAQRRVAETTKWWIDATRPGGMERGAPGWRSTLQVRLIHAMVRRHLQRHPEWDAGQYGLPVNQGDMHATYLAFSVIFLFGQRLLGVPLTAREGHAAMHLWKYIGWLMGIDEHWLGDGEQAGRIALYQNLLAQAPPDETSRQLGRPLADEPLQRRYRRLAWLQGRWNRAKHLSIARAFVGRRGMDALGLPEGVLPWYPLLTIGPRLGWHLAHRLLPGGRERLVRRGLKVQEEYLEVLFGDGEKELTRPMDGH